MVEVGTATVVILPVIVTRERLAAAFTEWERRYREEPERFLTEQEAHQGLTTESYGEACAPYFLSILTSTPE